MTSNAPAVPTRSYPSAGDEVFTPFTRAHGTVLSDKGGEIVIQWSGNSEKDHLTYSRFAIAFDWVSFERGSGRWELIR